MGVGRRPGSEWGVFVSTVVAGNTTTRAHRDGSPGWYPVVYLDTREVLLPPPPRDRSGRGLSFATYSKFPDRPGSPTHPLGHGPDRRRTSLRTVGALRVGPPPPPRHHRSRRPRTRLLQTVGLLSSDIGPSSNSFLPYLKRQRAKLTVSGRPDVQERVRRQPDREAVHSYSPSRPWFGRRVRDGGRGSTRRVSEKER